MTGLGGVTMELGHGFGEAGTEALRASAEEEPGEQMGGDGCEETLQAGEQQDGRFAGLRA